MGEQPRVDSDERLTVPPALVDRLKAAAYADTSSSGKTVWNPPEEIGGSSRLRLVAELTVPELRQVVIAVPGPGVRVPGCPVRFLAGGVRVGAVAAGTPAGLVAG